MQPIPLVRPISAFARRVGHNYQKLPGWIVLPQLFLAAGWGRAGLAHSLSSEWWNGRELLDFVATETERRVRGYQYVLTGIVEPFPSAVATAIALAELLIGVMLLLNHRASVALGLGAFLNLQFMLAGVVNPSVFYLVAAMGIVIWRLETVGDPVTIARLSRKGPMVAVVCAGLLAPSVETVKPDHAMEDPALVLIFVAALATGAVLWVDHRIGLANRTLAELTDQ